MLTRMHPDDERMAKVSKKLRRQLGLRQIDVRGRPERSIIRLERGLAGRLRLDDLRDHFSALGATVRVTVWWQGAALDRLLDGRHAGIVERLVGYLVRAGWATDSEVSFNDYGDRGSIDVLARNEAASAAFVGEVKSEWGSLEETNRRLDVKARLAPKIVFERYGWRPRYLAVALVMPDERTNRRIAHRHGETLGAAYPARAREVRRWIRQPKGALRGLWFLSERRDSAGEDRS